MASKLNPKQLKWRDFILTVFRKEAPATKATLKKLMDFYAEPDNKDVDKYGDALFTSFFMTYTFKSFKDYEEIMKIIKEAEYFGTGHTVYSKFASHITNRLIRTESVKDEWIIESVAKHGSFYEINNFIAEVYQNSKLDTIQYPNKIIDEAQGYKMDVVVYEAIIRHGMLRKKIKGLEDVFEHIFSINDEIDANNIDGALFNQIQDKTIKNIVGTYIYKKTRDIKYLPEDAKDIFIF